MESFHWYKGFGVLYQTFLGITSVQGRMGFVIMEFPFIGEIAEREAAHKFIDELTGES